MAHRDRLKRVHKQMNDHLENGILAFWRHRSVDPEYGGFLTWYDAAGRPAPDTSKYLVTQTRMIWGYAALSARYPDREEYRRAADNGVRFLLDHFLDEDHGGWYWKTDRAGNLIDDGKVVYGQSFTIYALAEYARAAGLSGRPGTPSASSEPGASDPPAAAVPGYPGEDALPRRALEAACSTFDLLQKYAADTRHGGYLENLEVDWSVSGPGFPAGDRKSLDIHMHLMEAFTVLFQVTGAEIHRRKLIEVADLVLEKMTRPEVGCGLNQFDTAFRPIPAINIRRTWNAERETGETIDTPVDSTSYGHNVEMAWLFNRCGDALGDPRRFAGPTRRFVDHALRYGFDEEYGGVYRDGPHEGEALVKDKEWWQNSEVLVGFLDAWELHEDPRYLDAFEKTWEFDRRYFIHPELGEWRQLLTREGDVICGDLGNPWKAFYHSGRSILECLARLERLMKEEE